MLSSFSRRALHSQGFRKCLLLNLQRATCSGRHPGQITSQDDAIQKAANEESSPLKAGYGEKEIFLLGPTDLRTPLPGNMGIPPLSVLCIDTISQLPEPAGEKCEVTTRQMPEERYQTLLTQVSCIVSADVLSLYPLECTAYDCPQLLKKDFSDLFPGRDLSAGNLTVITLCQKTKNNMSEWSEDAEIERAALESSFLTAATGICTQLKCHSYWADFIHPNSGKPNFNPLTSATLFETDVRYRHLGFTIEDLGCCRVMLHQEWGAHAFVGAIFTNAPSQGREVLSAIERRRPLPPSIISMTLFSTQQQ